MPGYQIDKKAAEEQQSLKATEHPETEAEKAAWMLARIKPVAETGRAITEMSPSRTQKNKLMAELNGHLIGRYHVGQIVDLTKASIIHTDSGWLCWEVHRWIEITVAEVEHIIQRTAESLIGEGIANSFVREVRKTLAINCILPQHDALTNPDSEYKGDPRWIGSKNFITGERLEGNSFTNGTLKISSPLSDQHSIDWTPGHDKTEYWHCSTDIAYADDYLWDGTLTGLWADLERLCPQFNEYLKTVCSYESDEGSQPTEQEKLKLLILQMLGQYLLGVNPYHKFWFVFGPGGTGKSTLTHIIDALIGRGNMYQTDIVGLTDEKTTISNLILNKAVAVHEIQQYPNGNNAPREQALSLIKMLTGQDIIQERRMYQQHTPERQGIFNVHVTANDLPKMTNSEGSLDAIKRRAEVLPLLAKVDKPDPVFVESINDPTQLSYLAAIVTQLSTTEPYSVMQGQYQRTRQSQMLLDSLAEYPHQEALAMASLTHAHDYITVAEAQALLAHTEGKEYTSKRASSIFRKHFHLGPTPQDRSHRIITPHIGHDRPSKASVIYGIGWNLACEELIVDIMSEIEPSSSPAKLISDQDMNSVSGRHRRTV